MLEPGNKVYYDELSGYFDASPEFTSKNLKFADLVDDFKVDFLDL